MALKPEYEVIHFLQSSSRGATELPHLLAGSVPPPRTDSAADESNIGSKNYADPAKAIILGGGPTDDDIKLMRDACEKEGLLGIPWIRPDLSKATPPLRTREYGLAVVERAKAMLKELEENGELGKDGVYYY